MPNVLNIRSAANSISSKLSGNTSHISGAFNIGIQGPSSNEGTLNNALNGNSVGSEYAGGEMVSGTSMETLNGMLSGNFNINTGNNSNGVNSSGSSSSQQPPSKYSTTGGAGASQNGEYSSGKEEVELIKPYNPTDPVVVFDPTFEKPGVVRDYVGETPSDKLDPEGNKTMVDNLQYEGVKIPMIQLNNLAIDHTKIINFKLKCCNFLPEVELKVNDYDGIISSSDIQGINSSMIVILFSNVEGTNKKISLDFYITECNVNNDGTIDYKGVMNLTIMTSRFNKQIGSGKINTYAMFEQIAKENRLGFAATPNCNSVCDNRYRQLYRETYIDFINDQLSYAGDGVDNIFEAWVDPFGYLVLVNVAWLMSYEVKPLQLVTKSINGLNNSDKETEEFKNTSKEILREITNSNEYAGIDNMHFDMYTNNVNNNDVVDKGTTSKYYYLVSPGDSNLIQTAEGMISEMSVDGVEARDYYNRENIEFIGIEFNEDDDDEGCVPTVVQKKNIENFKSNIYSKTITVEMSKANFMLERGTLILVDIEEQNEDANKMLINESDVVFADKASEEVIVKNENTEEQEFARKTMLYNDKFNSMRNVSLSGMYYIKDITYKYSIGDPEISQEMTLAKRGIRTNILNMTTARKSDLIEENN